ncbi:MAG: PEP-CTERM sorting domain-containing protein [Verrucomicrobia bacterium]|nr:PEP-CTERM sorting domain-containing protein [Verrucomicrobiota bacterium]
MRSFALLLTAAALSIAGSAAATTADIGGDPIHVQQDTFAADNWVMEVTSFVFDYSSSSLPAGVPELNEGEALFVYFLDMDNSVSTSTNNFNVGNPNLYPVSSVGWLSPLWVVPVVDGSPTTDTFQDPYLYGYSGPAQATVFTFSGNFFDPWCTLDPNEYSLVYYVAQSGWELVPGTVSGGGVSDNELLPGPGETIVPEPSILVLLGVGVLATIRSRR